MLRWLRRRPLTPSLSPDGVGGEGVAKSSTPRRFKAREKGKRECFEALSPKLRLGERVG
jgi:hypothetical protein